MEFQKGLFQTGYTYYTQGCTKWFDFAKITKKHYRFLQSGIGFDLFFIGLMPKKNAAGQTGVFLEEMCHSLSNKIHYQAV